MLKLSNRTVIEIVIAVWIVVAVGYLTHTPIDYRAHDISGHLEYTKIVFSELRLPNPYEGWETFHPPLYYLINSLIVPPHNILEALHHIIYVRYASVFYGLISILIIAWFLMKIDISPFSRMLVLLFVVTTPKFVFVFTSYNNDSLATFLSIAIIGVSYKLFLKWSSGFAALLMLLSIAGNYTKYSVLISDGILIFILLLNWFISLLRLKQPDKTQLRIISILVFSIILFSPWLYFHNYKNTGKLFPTNTEKFLDRNLDKKQIKNFLGVVLRIPKLQLNKIDYSKEWNKPWVYPGWNYVHPSTKRYDYLAFSFVTSVIGEYVFKKPSVVFFWILLYIHLLAYLAGLTVIFKSNLTKLSFCLVLLSHLIQIFSILFYPTLPHHSMDYRYISWNFSLWALLYSSVFISKFNIIRYIFAGVFLLGILFQIYILFTLEGGYWD